MAATDGQITLLKELISNSGLIVVAGIGLLAASGMAYGKDTRSCGSYTLEKESVAVGFSERQDYFLSVLQVRDGEGRLVRSFTERKLAARWCQDITGDGVPEIMIEAMDRQDPHCCWSYALYSMGSEVKNRLIFLGYDQRIPFEDVRNLDQTSSQELLVQLNFYSDFTHDVPYWDPLIDWPTLPAILCYRGERYVDCTRDFPILLEEQIDRAEKALTEKSRPVPSGEGHEKRWALTFYGLHLLNGRDAAGWRKLRDLVSGDVLSWLSDHRDQIRKVTRAGASDRIYYER